MLWLHLMLVYLVAPRLEWEVAEQQKLEPFLAAAAAATAAVVFVGTSVPVGTVAKSAELELAFAELLVAAVYGAASASVVSRAAVTGLTGDLNPHLTEETTVNQ